MRGLVFVISSLFLAAPGLAQASDDDAATNSSRSSQTVDRTGNNRSSAAREEDDRQICRRVDTNTGSRVPHRRVCMTEREWRVFLGRD
jgi:hypothetical protein